MRTMGARLTRLKPRAGFCAETAAAISILTPTALGIPVSTTHVIAGAIAGVGSIQRLKAVRWGLATNILWAWIMTIPASAAVGALSMLVITALVGTRDLGQEVYIALTKADVGRGLVAGLCVAAIAIIADRLIQTAARGLAARQGGRTREP